MEKRTLRQNRAMHLAFDLLGKQLNDAGLDMKQVLKPNIAIPWNKMTVKKYLWKPIQEAMYGTDSTTNLTTKQVHKVWDVLMRHLGEQFGVVQEFPSIEYLIDDYENWSNTENTKLS